MQQHTIFNYENIKLLYIHWKKVIFIPFFIAIITFIFTTIMPRTYRAHATILPPVEDEFGSFASLMSDLPLKALGLGSVSSGTELFLVILNSRTITESVVDKFDLIKVLHQKDLERTVKKLRKQVGANLDDEGTISIFVDATTPWFSSHTKKETARIRAKEMTNFYIRELDRINQKIRSERARNNREFIGKRYQQNVEELKATEDKLISYQKEHGILMLPEQIAATINSAAEIKAQILTNEIQLELYELDFGQNNTKSQSFQNEIKILQRKYNELNSGISLPVSKSSETNNNNLFLPLQKLPDFSVDYIRFMRDVKIQEKLMEFLLPQYEQAKIQEVKDTPTLQVLDWAVKPIHKYRPKRIIFMMFFSFIGFLMVLFHIYIQPKIVLLHHEIKNS